MTHQTQPAIHESAINLHNFYLFSSEISLPRCYISFYVLFTGVYSYRLTPLYQGDCSLIFESNNQTSVDFANLNLVKIDEFIANTKKNHHLTQSDRSGIGSS